MIKTLKNEQGITLLSLVTVIGLMIIITSVLIYNITTSGHVRSLDNMNKDITLLRDKVDVYYAKYGALPVLETKYTNTSHLKGLNANDNDTYYVIDLQLLDNITLTYGQAYQLYKALPKTTNADLYIINEQSHNIYYVEGISFDDKTYYTIVEE